MNHLMHFLSQHTLETIKQKVSKYNDYKGLGYTAFYGNGDLIIYPIKGDSKVYIVEEDTLKEF